MAIDNDGNEVDASIVIYIVAFSTLIVSLL